MEKLMRLPPGFRFHPTDEELVVQYLCRKVYSYPLPAAVIPEIDLAKFDPWDLPGDFEGEKYFFSLREAKFRVGNRATGSGYWKITGKDKPIYASKRSEPVGMKKVLVFHRGKPARGSKTDWIMHEYRLAMPEPATSISPHRKSSAQDWVVCRIFMKKRAPKNDEENTQYYANNSSSSSSTSTSSASCVTDLSDGGCDREEEATSRSVA